MTEAYILNLKDFVPPWEREIADRVRETEFDRILRGDMDVPVASGTQDVIRQGRPLAQDVFRSIVIRQRRI